MKHGPEKQVTEETRKEAVLAFVPKQEMHTGRAKGDSFGIGAFTAEMTDAERALAHQEGRGAWKSSNFEEERELDIKRRIHTLKGQKPLPLKEKEELESLYFELGKIKDRAHKVRAKTQLTSSQRESLREIVLQINTSEENDLLNTPEFVARNEKLAHDIDKLTKTINEAGKKERAEEKEAGELLNALRTEKKAVEDILSGYKPGGKLSREEFLAQKLLESVGFKNKTRDNENKKDSRKPTIFNLTNANEAMQNDMNKLAVQPEVETATLNETNHKEKNMNQELPPLEFTQENTMTEERGGVPRVEARVKEVAERLKEIAEKTDIASIEEKVELEKEAASLEEKRKEIENNKPLHTAYDAAMARLQEEDKMSVVKRETKTEIATENNVGNSQKLTAIEGSFSKRLDGEIKPVLSQEQVLEINAKNAEKRERILGNFSKLEKQREVTAEKMGVLDRVRAVGKKWNSLPKHYKLLFTAGLVLSGAGAAIVGSAVAGGAIATIATGSRALAGAGLFATFEEMMRRSHERKTGSPITEAVAARQAVLSGTLAILMVSMLPTAMHNVLEGTGATEALASVKITGATESAGAKHLAPILPDELLNNGASLENKGLSEIVQAMQTGDAEAVRLTEETLGITHEEALRLIDERKIVAPEMPTSANLAEQASYIETAKAGDSVWKMSEHQLKAHYGEKFTGLSQEKQAYLINAIKDRVAQYPEAHGMLSADADKLSVGENVDFGGIFNDKEFMDTQFAEAKQMVALKDLSTISDSAATEQRDVLMDGNTSHPEQSEWLKQFNASLAERMTADQAQTYGNEIGKALAVNDMDKVFEIEKTMGITHEEFLRLVEETKKIEGGAQVNIPENITVHEVVTPQIEGKIDTSAIDASLQENTEGVVSEKHQVPAVESKEISVPKDAQVLAFADKQVHEHINSLFGTKGFLGFGSEAGMDSAHWKHPKVGFGSKTVGEIMTAKPEAFYEDGSKHFGIEDSSATQKMQDYLKSMFKETGLQPKPEATAESYIRDAEAIKFAKLMNKG